MYRTSQITVMFLWCIQNWFSDFSVMCILRAGLMLLHQQQTKSRYGNVCLQKMQTVVFSGWEKEKEVIWIKPESKRWRTPKQTEGDQNGSKGWLRVFITFPAHVHHISISWCSSHFHLMMFITFPSHVIIIIIDRFYLALFSAFEQTHCACMWFYMSE